MVPRGAARRAGGRLGGAGVGRRAGCAVRPPCASKDPGSRRHGRGVDLVVEGVRADLLHPLEDAANFDAITILDGGRPERENFTASPWSESLKVVYWFPRRDVRRLTS